MYFLCTRGNAIHRVCGMANPSHLHMKGRVHCQGCVWGVLEAHARRKTARHCGHIGQGELARAELHQQQRRGMPVVVSGPAGGVASRAPEVRPVHPGRCALVRIRHAGSGLDARPGWAMGIAEAPLPVAPYLNKHPKARRGSIRVAKHGFALGSRDRNN